MQAIYMRQRLFDSHDEEFLGAFGQEGNLTLVVRYDVEVTHRRRFVSEICDEHTICDEAGK